MGGAGEVAQGVGGLYERRGTCDHVAVPRADDGFEACGQVVGDGMGQHTEAPLTTSAVDRHPAPGRAHGDLRMVVRPRGQLHFDRERAPSRPAAEAANGVPRERRVATERIGAPRHQDSRGGHYGPRRGLRGIGNGDVDSVERGRRNQGGQADVTGDAQRGDRHSARGSYFRGSRGG